MTELCWICLEWTFDMRQKAAAIRTLFGITHHVSNPRPRQHYVFTHDPDELISFPSFHTLNSRGENVAHCFVHSTTLVLIGETRRVIRHPVGDLVCGHVQRCKEWKSKHQLGFSDPDIELLVSEVQVRYLWRNT
jgi:hypothetical protein